jgi:hypothetical protein
MSIPGDVVTEILTLALWLLADRVPVAATEKVTD